MCSRCALCLMPLSATRFLVRPPRTMRTRRQGSGPRLTDLGKEHGLQNSSDLDWRTSSQSEPARYMGCRGQDRSPRVPHTSTHHELAALSGVDKARRIAYHPVALAGAMQASPRCAPEMEAAGRQQAVSPFIHTSARLYRTGPRRLGLPLPCVPIYANRQGTHARGTQRIHRATSPRGEVKGPGHMPNKGTSKINAPFVEPVRTSSPHWTCRVVAITSPPDIDCDSIRPHHRACHTVE